MQRDMELIDVAPNLCEAERDRLCASEICIDEALTILERHGFERDHLLMQGLAGLSGMFHLAMTETDGIEKRMERLSRIRGALTEAMPLTDRDLRRG